MEQREAVHYGQWLSHESFVISVLSLLMKYMMLV